MKVLRRCLSSSTFGGKSIIRRKREAPKSVPFESHMGATKSRR
eukprot:CAMPEP_0197833856 /NCGR_PEP_ID=MMETSP1437-20131217/20354_1 /TAXON_ID=49252 ORGANISM="Eucampia antarctica, Strain CCMP1452" /NCGR_SAMPLE_ID=MMETSP1437 /ASSEMBLY_ACC=CAM_ASM_001096 /LENGTH=42 /DNA_ID= /DNA_START= /DNA_END= /DNA_ORIENTATION=